MRRCVNEKNDRTKKQVKAGRAMAAATAMMMVLALAGCASSKGNAAPQSTGAAETTVTTAPSMENVAENEDTADTSNADAENQAQNGVIETEATYVEHSDFSEEGRLVFENEQLGTFIVLVSDVTSLPETLTDGETYVISHAEMMTMSEPGQLPQVYAVRAVGDAYHDSIGTVQSVEVESVLFEQADGTQFMVGTENLGGLSVKEGDVCVVSHTDAMTRSMPGTYMEVSRVQLLPTE